MWKSAGRIILAVSAVAIVFWLATFASFEPEVRLSAPGGYAFPTFRLPVLNAALFEGDTTFIDSESLRGNVAVVTFWATWCAPWIAEQPSLLALQDEFSDEGLIVLGVLHQDRPGPALEWLIDNDRLGLRTVVGTSLFARSARVGGLPNTALVDRNGTVTELFLGYWPERDPYVRDAVRNLLASAPTS